MAKITYIEDDGTEHAIDVENGMTVMEGAIQNSIPGIDADCGGACACATCHVYVDEPWLAGLPEKSEGETEMLECATADLKAGSRLGCQITVDGGMDGLTVYVPYSQQ